MIGDCCSLAVIDHYYHFAAELLLGVWRTYASLGRAFGPDGTTTLPAPARAWFIRHTEQTWRDKPRFNSAILWSAFPSMSVLYQDDWADIKRSTSSGLEKAYIFPRAILADRSAAFRGQHTASTSRTVASAMQVGDPGPWWWEPVRRQVLRFAGVQEDVLDISLEGYGAVDPANLSTDPDLVKELTPPAREPLSSLKEMGKQPLVTYISRQSSRRRLTPDSHKDLVKALEAHSKANGWELMVVEAEKLSKEEQLQLAARTTVSGAGGLREGSGADVVRCFSRSCSVYMVTVLRISCGCQQHHEARSSRCSSGAGSLGIVSLAGFPLRSGLGR